MKFLTGILLAVAAMAQTPNLTLSTSSSGSKAGGSVTLSVNSNLATMAAVQWSLSLPAGVTVVPTVGAAATAASKVLNCNSTGTLCLLSGLNQNLIGVGILANYTVTFPANVSGPQNFTINFPVAADAGASKVTVISGPTLPIAILSKYDLTGDGRVDILDVQVAITQVITGSCTTADVNGDGSCDVLDVAAVILSALGVTGFN